MNLQHLSGTFEGNFLDQKFSQTKPNTQSHLLFRTEFSVDLRGLPQKPRHPEACYQTQ